MIIISAWKKKRAVIISGDHGLFIGMRIFPNIPIALFDPELEVR